ncbi:MAG: ABC transporter ATP-binding protein [Deltaproteobacteria bacterium]|nr:ABC transporter ATP-binding protein [Deltaproteobacteria bacterium]
MIDVQELSKTYSQGQSTVTALSPISFHVSKAQSVAIVGQSGSGKTTLLSLLAGLEIPSSGRVVIKEQSLFDLNEKQRSDFRAHHMGFVFQQYHLMPHLTAIENVCLPLDILQADGKRQDKASAFLEKVGLADRMNHLPSKLSGGECQRVAIARAFVASPSIVLADEPSGNLDPKTGDAVMDLLFELIHEHQMTLMMVTHDQNLAARCDKIITMQEV